MSAGIYKITNHGDNIDNGKCYIGLSRDLEKRKKQHYHSSTTIKGKNNKKLYWAMDTFNSKNFSFDVLEYCDVSELGKKEIYYIKQYNSFHNGYNSSEGGEGIQTKDLVDRFDLTCNLNLKLIDQQDYADPNVINKRINYLNEKIVENRHLLATKEENLNLKKLKYQQNKKDKKVIKIELKIDLLKNKLDQKFNWILDEKKINLKILELLLEETKLKQEYLKVVTDYIKKPFIKLKAEAFNSSIEKKFNIKGPAYNVHNFQKNNQKYQEINHYSNFGILNIYSKYLSFKPNERSSIKLLFEEISEIVFIIYEDNVHINFNGWSQNSWNQINSTYENGLFKRPDSFYLIFSNTEFQKLIEVILSVRRELRI